MNKHCARGTEVLALGVNSIRVDYMEDAFPVYVPSVYYNSEHQVWILDSYILFILTNI